MSSKYNFTLKHINHQNLIDRYNLFYAKDEKTPGGVTRINELSDKKEVSMAINLDIKNITMYDYLSQDAFPKTTNLSCFWCRNPFETIPIGCPIKYFSPQIEKVYYSEIHKDNYTILHNIQEKKQTDIKKTESYYETDGIFCSFNCCISFIQDNPKNPLYSFSQSLLSKVYLDIFGKVPENIVPAPHWRMLKSYGGSLTIQEFRENSMRLDLACKERIREIPKLKTIGWIFESKNN